MMLRRKGSAARTWLVLDGEGKRKVVEASKQIIMRRTGVSTRDLRVLDPLLSYPSTIVGRDRAMLINLEHIKAIITAHEVLLLNSTDHSVVPFVQHLHQRILTHHRATQQQPQEDRDETKQLDDMKILPFEFLTLEACLEAACTALENEAEILEQETYPALDKLTSKISTLNLEGIRLVKSRLVALAARVRRIRDELEHWLDNNEDMAELYLTEKLVQQQLENSTTLSMNDMEYEVLHPDINDRIPPEISLERGGDSASDDEDDQNAGTDESAETKNTFDVEELEMLLGAYFVQIGGTLNKLSRLREYVDDTEDYINIALDEKQNRLLQIGVKFSTSKVLLSAFICVTAIFSINIHIDLFDTGMPQFLATCFGGTAACIFIYFVAITWFKHQGLVD
ncbi:magnesium transporter MRS2-3 [Cajanus cajan]|uniref:magnesium transporter MRS2-3 n=1 Tax=Cajanus cajan TaxID=3821 RepID=UPI00098DB010|nr:magnesium transporter MRS2-3 [Cajanus cajan]